MSRAQLGEAYAPRLLRRTAAARYVGVSANKFDELVRERVFPAAKRITDNIKGWDRFELDAAVDGLDDDAPSMPLDTSWDD